MEKKIINKESNKMKKENKKIGIVTFSRAHNYGSILQAYALQKYISKNYPYECEIIDFSNKNQKEMYSIFKSNNSLKNIVKNIIGLVTFPLMKREFNDFENFIDNNLVFSEKKYKSSTEMVELNNIYDIFISGSDQVWNIKCKDADDVYFLNFVKDKKKIAYAPSFGAQDLSKCSSNPEKYSNYLKDFNCLSIRENNGKKWIKNLTGIDVPVLIDPTMFYSKEDWYPLMSKPLIKKPYILYYSFHFTQEVNKAVKRISQKLGLPVIVLSAHAWVYNLCSLYGFSLAKHSSPAEFLRLINDAEIVLSNSFHGTVFSAIYEKNFWFLYGSIQDSTDDRALTLVKQIGIEDRILKLEDIDNCDFSILPDYAEVKKKLAFLRKEAFDYLDDSINK